VPPEKLSSTSTPVSVPSEELNLFTLTDVELEKEPDVAEYETEDALAATAPKKEATIERVVQNIFISLEGSNFSRSHILNAVTNTHGLIMV